MRTLTLLAWMLLWGCGAAFAADAVPATTYFPVLPFGAPDDAAPQFVPVAANHPLDGVYAGVTRAIVVIHDTTRDASGALAMMSALAGDANASTMIVAPQFLLPSDIGRFAGHLPQGGKGFAAWQMAGWPQGDDSAAAEGRRSISSFAVVDLLLMVLADRDRFPDLRTIAVAGFGAGADFVQRYAAFGIAADAVARENIDLRYVVADASSYLYLTGNRPFLDKEGFGPPNAAACPGFDAYPYGLDKLNAYAGRVGANAAKLDYALRFITYLNAPVAAVTPASTCAELLQGKDDAARAANYELYLQTLYSNVAAKTQKFWRAKTAFNDAVGLFGSACGMAVLFGDGMCGVSP